MIAATLRANLPEDLRAAHERRLSGLRLSYLLPRPDPCRKRLRHIGTSVGGRARATRTPLVWANRASDHPQSGVPVCAVPEKPRSTRFPHAVPHVSCATMAVRQGAVRGGQPSP